MSNEQNKPSADDIVRYGYNHEETSLIPRSDGDWVDYIEHRVVLARVRREARAEAFEEARAACFDLADELRESERDRGDLGDECHWCSRAINDLAAKERAS